jgi:hypothetical protein
VFPTEIMAYPQWVCWKYAKTSDDRLTKLPYCPKTGQLASVADPLSWSDYETAVKAASNGNFYSGIGFVLTDNDPFCFIDLDNPEGDAAIIARHTQIAEAMDSYSEVSPSGFGLHVIVKAKVAGGRRRSKVEVYSSMRYMTMSGNTYHDKPIADRSYLVQKLWEELNDNKGGNNIDIAVANQPQQYSDEEIYNTANQAQNGEKFSALWQGDWVKYYKSQSEADFALINILGFYSRNVDQIRRMFLLSQLGKRDKAKRKNYIDGMIKRSFDNQPPMIPLEQIKISVANELARKDAEKDKHALSNPFAGPLFENVADPDYDWTVPPGLLGEISQFIFAAAPRPVKEIALAAGIGLMAGICGRSYNVSGTGLNQYVLVLAKTGSGKEAAASGIDRLMQAVKRTVPAAMDFVGPADIASGQALIKYLSKQPCFVSIVGEFGLVLQQMCSMSANASQVMLRKNLLALYNKSGHTDLLQPTIYSDKDKNTQVVKSPSFSILGESTPETFYASMDESIITQGLLPRFTCIEYTGNRPRLNRNHQEMQPSQDLVRRLADIATNCLVMAQHNRVVEVTLDAEAQKFGDSFNLECDGKINTSEIEVARQLWNRAHIKMLKLAALIAIGINPYSPVIDIQAINWAKNLVERDCLNILKQFETGKAGKDTGELNQINELLHIIEDYLKRPYTGMEKYQVMPEMHRDHVIGVSYLQRRLFSKGSFKNDRIGSSGALKRAIESLVADGSIREMRELDMYKHYGKTMKAYIVVDPYRFV